MKYYATIYIKTMQAPSLVPHTFLGLTKENPNKLGKQEIEIQKYKDDYLIGGQFLVKTQGKWYENIYPSILSDDFQGEGFWGFGPESKIWKSGKVFENNQYNHEPYENVEQFNDNPYKKTDIRSSSTFQGSNYCTFEISQEQYDKLLKLIKEDVLSTLYINKNSNAPITQELKYDFTNNNCTTWVLNKLDSIGIEVIDVKEWIPDIVPNPNPHYAMAQFVLKQAFDIEFNLINTLKDSFQALADYHFVFRKFQNIDKDLESITGAKAFRDWARGMIDNRFVCQLEPNYNRLSKYDIKCSNEEEGLFASLKKWKENLQHKRQKLIKVYKMLNKVISSQIEKVNDLQGSFTFISYNKQTHKIQLRNKQSNYEPYDESKLDPNIPANNWSLNQLSPFIFIPKDEIHSRVLYHKYDYGKISDSYIESINQSYLGILSDNDNLTYWSKALHKLRKSANQPKEIENV
ncbi:Uncharacterised protein [Helicobacter fennelliae]|uniref:Uncharacterized protein n=1 Tax=Helicobacter fennelliae TaxID=215 RepID=A0A2X3EFV6_9HELI|nr:hypothetical protein [Helicobacter fennelliae]SQC36466.1 Uncharacterised protein [Helicobacter fennelliae]